MLQWVHEKYDNKHGPVQAKTIQYDLMQQFDQDVSLTTVRKILRIELGMSYKKIYRGNPLANSIKAKQKRQYAAVMFAKLLA